ncbi:MAG: valine--tRNA ligase, partial [Alphaproteobacteria bacterium]|nr:valine--tRNA ligase [Alphaproteobacteria bacterium]
GATVPLMIKDAEPLAAQRLANHREHFVRRARVERFQPVDALAPGGVQVITDGATLILGLGEVIDFARERERLGREIGRLDAELAKLAAKLANPNFLAKAKAEVVEEQREREVDAKRERNRLKAAYDLLGT